MFLLLITLVALQRIVELAIAERNRRRLLARGAIEYGRGHYPLMVAMHVAFYLSLVFERHLASTSWDPLWPLWLAIFLAAQAFRVWVQVSLGGFWTTRILVLPGAAPVRHGPYRFIRHPNYVVVALELLTLPILCGAYITAVVFSLMNAALLFVRIRVEEQAMSKWIPATGLASLPRFIPSRKIRSEPPSLL